MLQKGNLERFTSEIGIRMRINRSIQVEGAFGFNIRKLHNRISANRIGKRFLDKAAA